MPRSGGVVRGQDGAGMKIAVLSDIHANLQALKAVLRDSEAQRVDEYWLLGDYVDYGASAKETVSLLSSIGARHIIAGNHDACLYDPYVRCSATPHGKKSYEYTKRVVEDDPQSFEWLKSIAHVPSALITEEKTLLIHGTPADPYWGKIQPGDDMDILFEEMERRNVDRMLIGHSHVSFMLTHQGRTIINPGSVGQPRNGCPDAAYAILEGDAVTFRRVKYDVGAAADEIKKAGLPEYLWQRLYIGS